MNAPDPKFYHSIRGEKRTRAVYRAADFPDYVAMLLLTALVLVAVYGPLHPLAIVGLLLCCLMLVAFVVRHGVNAGVPLLLRRPQELAYTVIAKLGNLRGPYFVAVGVLVLENVVIRLTPQLPHHVELVRNVGFGLFYLHLLLISVYRTAILIDHLRKRDLVREVLEQTAWKKALDRQGNITYEIFHAYVTGILTHIVAVAPWYLVIAHLDFSVILAPIVLVIAAINQRRFMREINSWFYREHWLGHNSEFEFLYLHGTHHDAIPSGMIGVAGAGILEVMVRHTIGVPQTFYNPLAAFAAYSMEVKMDIDTHQFIPGVYPRLPLDVIRVAQHSTHHYGRLEPYGFGLKAAHPDASERIKQAMQRFPPEFSDSIELDEALTGYQWDNQTHRQIVKLYETYQSR
jgi:hypothetical protein